MALRQGRLELPSRALAGGHSEAVLRERVAREVLPGLVGDGAAAGP